MSWKKVEEALPDAKAIIFDGCHKIYLAMDEEQVKVFESYGYGSDNDGSVMIKIDPTIPALETLVKWFDDSCSLRFIESVRSVPAGEDPNSGFKSLIPQFEFEREEED